MRCVDVVTRCREPVGRIRTEKMSEASEKIRVLLRASGVEWDVSVKAWDGHGVDEVLWKVSGVRVGVDTEEVKVEIISNVRALWGDVECIDVWVEWKRSRYVRIDGILEEDWLKGEVKELRKENGAILWGHRDPVVTKSAWKKVSVKVEVESAAAAYATVRGGVL